jgi:hypothetical protein
LFGFHANEGEMMMSRTKKHRWMTLLLVTASWLAGSLAEADVVTDWNITAGEIAVAARLPPPPTYRIMALVQSAVYEAVNAITKRYPPDRVRLDAAPGASIDAAVAEANRATLVQLVPAQQPAIDKAYQAVLSPIPEGQAKTAGLAVGAKAAAAILVGRRGRRRHRRDVPAPHHGGGLRADRHPRGLAVAAAQALADDEPRPVPSWSTARADQRGMGTRLQ